MNRIYNQSIPEKGLVLSGVRKDFFPSHVFDMQENQAGDIFLSSESGVFKYDRYNQVRMDWFDKEKGVLLMGAMQDKMLFVHSNIDISVLEGDSFYHIPFHKHPYFKEFASISVFDIEIDCEHEKVYIVPKGGLRNSDVSVLELDVRTKAFKVLDIAIENKHEADFKLVRHGKCLYVIYADTINRVRVYTVQGQCDSGDLRHVVEMPYNIKLKHYEITEDAGRFFLHRRSDHANLCRLDFEGEMSSVIEDYEGNLWVSTHRNGVWFFEVNLLAKQIAEADPVYIKTVQLSMHPELWYSKQFGFFIPNDSRYGYKHVYYQYNHTLLRGNDSIRIGYNAIISNGKRHGFGEKVLCYGLNGNSFYLALNAGLVRYDIKKDETRQVFAGKVSCITPDSTGRNLYFSSGKNIYRLEKDGRTILFAKCQSHIKALQPYRDGFLYSIFNGVFFVSSSGSFRMISTVREVRDLFIYGTNLLMADHSSIYEFELGNSFKLPELKLLLRFEKAALKGDTILTGSRELNFYCGIKSNYNQNGRSWYILIKNGDTIINNKVVAGWINISNLGYGNYKLIISGINDLGAKSRQYAYYMDIPAFYYETLWFRILMLMLVIAAIIIIVNFIYGYNKRLILSKNLQLENENYQLQLLKSQLNPHFLFNALNSLKGLVYLDRKSQALDYTDRLSTFLRNILSSNQNLECLLSEELIVIKNYVDIERIRLDGKIELELLCEEDLKQMFVPSNILQPIVENCVKYAYNSTGGNLHIRLECTRHKDELWIIIDDNGIGISHLGSKQSFSLGAIRNRVNKFNAGRIRESFSLINIMQEGKITGVRALIKLRIYRPAEQSE